MGETLLDKAWSRHVVSTAGSECLLYVDRTFVHEESQQAFDALVATGRPLRRAASTIAFCDHYAPTVSRAGGSAAIADPERRAMVERLDANARLHRLHHYGLDHPGQGIMHVVGAENGHVLPGLLVVGSDSHTCTNGALGALAFGLGQSELRQVFLTGTVWRRKPPCVRVVLDGPPGPGVSAKDLVLHVIARIGAAGGRGAALEFSGSTIREMPMDARMTICNMSVEAGASSGMIAPDAVTLAWLEPRIRFDDARLREAALADWLALHSDADARFDREVAIDASTVAPTVTWGTSVEDAVPVDGCIPDPCGIDDPEQRARMARALAYMDLAPGMPVAGIPVDLAFIGSCSNGRLDDLRAAAQVVRGRRARVPAIVSPGSRTVRRLAEAEGLDRIFREAGFEWRDAGCSMCVGSNGDLVGPGQRCASTSPRNFEGRQGPGARTHVMSPAMAAAAAVTGRITDVRSLPAAVL